MSSSEDASLRELILKLRAGYSNPINFYLDNAKAILEIRKRKDLAICDIRTNNISLAERYLRVSAVFNDLSFVSAATGQKFAMTVLLPEAIRNKFGSDYIVHIPSEELSKRRMNPNTVACSPAFSLGDTDADKRFRRLIEPLAEAGKVIIQPSRMVILTDPNRPRNHEALGVTDDSPLDVWTVSGQAQDEIAVPILPMGSIKSQTELFEICMPYLSGVGFKDLAKILRDEGEYIGKARAALKETIRKANTEGADINEIRSDLIDPQLDELGRRFKTISRMRAFKMAGATVGTAVLAYCSYTASGLSEAITTIAGAGGGGVIANEVASYLTDKSELQEHPFYFLWRCRQIQRKTDKW